MKNYYTWDIHDKYARYWTKESILHQEAFRKLTNIEGETEFGHLFDIAEKYLSGHFNPHDLEEWKPPLLKEEIDEEEGVLLKGDFHSTWGGFDGHIVSQNMVDKIGDILKEYGDLFPLNVEDREDKLYRYWVNKEIPFECVDKQKSKFFKNKYEERGTFKIEKLVLKEECETDAIIFRVAGEYEKTIFVGEEFIELVKKHDLKGFKFEIDTSYEYTIKNDPYIMIG